MIDFYPLRFSPIFRRALWGGRRLHTLLGKHIGKGNCAESWEVVDRKDTQSIVAAGPLAGQTLGELVRRHGPSILGKHASQMNFPLLVKFLDARDSLSVQVHPNDAHAARLTPPDFGKTEAWVVMDAKPGSLIFAGLEPGVGRAELEREIDGGNCQHCLHSFEPRLGDCVLLPAGTAHSLGAGVLVAEIQPPGDTTYRLFDWNRLDAGGQPRELHIRQALDVIDYDSGPILPRTPEPTALPHVERLVTCDKFVMNRWKLDSPRQAGGDDKCHVFVVLDGKCAVEGDATGEPLSRGCTVLLPAAAGPLLLKPQGPTVLLQACLP